MFVDSAKSSEQKNSEQIPLRCKPFDESNRIVFLVIIYYWVDEKITRENPSKIHLLGIFIPLRGRTRDAFELHFEPAGGIFPRLKFIIHKHCMLPLFWMQPPTISSVPSPLATTSATLVKHNMWVKHGQHTRRLRVARGLPFLYFYHETTPSSVLSEANL